MTASKPEVKVHDKLYINGQWAEPAGTALLDVVNATTEEVMGRVPEGLRHFAAFALRYEQQTAGYEMLLTQRYPSFNVSVNE